MCTSGVSGIIGNAMRRAGVAGTPHNLWHWYGTNLVAAGDDLGTAQTLLSYTNLQTTSLYVAWPMRSGARRSHDSIRLEPNRVDPRLTYCSARHRSLGGGPIHWVPGTSSAYSVGLSSRPNQGRLHSASRITTITPPVKKANLVQSYAVVSSLSEKPGPVATIMAVKSGQERSGERSARRRLGEATIRLQKRHKRIRRDTYAADS
jgi:hypothetical protein